jgi:hypothetical protein
MPRLLALLVACSLVLTFTGCKDNDDPVVPQTPADVLPFPDTPDQLMANFKTAYADMDLAPYRDEVLNQDYRFILQDSTVEQFGLLDNIFDFADEVRIAGKMFTTQPNSLGQIISAIEMQIMQGQGAWTAVPEDDPDFGGVGALVRDYSILIYFNVQGDFRYETRGDQLFYVVADTVLHAGVMTPRFSLLGQSDQTSIVPLKSTEPTTWGTVKALYE